MMGLRSFLRFLPALLLLLPLLDTVDPLAEPAACLILLEAKFLMLVPFMTLCKSRAKMVTVRVAKGFKSGWKLECITFEVGQS